MRKTLIAVVVAVFAASIAVLGIAQSQNVAQQPPVFRSTTRLVQINVVVHDKNGPVGDLKKEDFTIYEKGKQQQIAFFTVDSLKNTPDNPVKLPPHIFSNQLAQRNGVPSGVTVILLDSLNTNFADQVQARKAVIEFLLQLKPTDHIAIYQLGQRLKILHDYTTDSTELINRLVESRAENLPDLEASQSQGKGFDLGPLIGGGGAEASFYMTNRILNTLKALEVIANHLSSVQGRKNLIWVSDGFPLGIGYDEIPRIGSPMRDQRIFSTEMDQTLRALNNAGVSMYPVDARGLMPPTAFSAENRSAPPLHASLPMFTNRDSMLELADRTGGRAYYNTNDLKNAIRQALGDSEITYTIGYHPTNPDMDGKFRDFKVKVDRPGLNVRYRKGYFAMKPTDETPEARKEEMRSALWSPLDATALPVNARMDFLPAPVPAADAPTPTATVTKSNTVQIVAQVDPLTITFEQKAGRYAGKLDVIMAQKDDRGNMVGDPISDTIELNLKPETYQKMMQAGFLYRKEFPRRSGASKVRVVVRDLGTGAIGSVTIPYKEIN